MIFKGTDSHSSSEFICALSRKKKMKGKKKKGIHPATEHHGTSWYTGDCESNLLFTPSSCHFVQTISQHAHLLLNYLTNS